MSSNPHLPREFVHRISEECGQQAGTFQAAARRILEDQARLVRFVKANLPAMKGQTGDVSLYLLAVVMRIFQRAGGTIGHVGAEEIAAATARVQTVGRSCFPADRGFPDRVRAVEWRAQPHILDEALFALFENEQRKANEVDVPDEQAALIFFMLWASTEALDAVWQAPPQPEW